MLVLYHGSPLIIEVPEFGKENPMNDYGLGFYCTEDIELDRYRNMPENPHADGLH